MRGITAPVFFFSSGLVFTYLLTRKAKPWRENERLYKGIGRGLQLIAIGYLLRINFLALLFKFDIYRWVAGVDAACDRYRSAFADRIVYPASGIPYQFTLVTGYHRTAGILSRSDGGAG